MDFTIRYLDESEYDLWDSFAVPQATIFSKTYRLKTKCNFKILAVFVRDELIAGIPFESKRIGIFNIARNPRLTQFLGLHISEKCKNIYIEAMIKKLNRDYNYVAINNHPSINDIRLFLWNGYSSEVRYTYILDILSLEKAWSKFNKSAQYYVRRSGCEFVVDNNRLFKVIDCDGNLHASAVIEWSGETAYNVSEYTNKEFKSQQSVYKLYWEIVRWLNYCGVTKLDLYGANMRQFAEFKRAFGGELVPYYRVKKFNLLNIC